MINKLISAVLLGILLFIWLWAGTKAPWINGGSFPVTGANGMTYSLPGLMYMVFTFLAFALPQGGK